MTAPKTTEICSAEGITVDGVDGAEVRKSFSVAFSNGDNWVHNPKIPKGHIWLEEGKDAQDRAYVLLHELVEAAYMEQFSAPYDEAHVLANTIESFTRKTDDIETALKVLEESTGLEEARVKKIKAVYEAFPKAAKKADYAPVDQPGVDRLDPGLVTEDPYDVYTKGFMDSPKRRGTVFDLATGTRWKGPRGVIDRALGGLGERGAMSDAGIDHTAPDFKPRISAAIEKHVTSPGGVEKLFGSTMGPMEAIAAIGPLGLLKAKERAGDPMLWAQAFGNAARTPGERVAAQRYLHAALSLGSWKNFLKGIDFKQMQLGLAGLTGRTRGELKLPVSLQSTSAGAFAAPNLAEMRTAPVLDPRLFSDNQTAAAMMAKGAHEKIAESLKDSWPTAKDPADTSEHLYHTIKVEDKVVGMVRVSAEGEGYHIANFWIRPGYRSHGYGKKLFERIIRAYGKYELTLKPEIFDSSPLSQEKLEKFYETFGFTKDGENMTRPAGGKEVEKVAVNWGALAAKLPKLLGRRVTPLSRAVTETALPRAAADLKGITRTQMPFDIKQMNPGTPGFERARRAGIAGRRNNAAAVAEAQSGRRILAQKTQAQMKSPVSSGTREAYQGMVTPKPQVQVPPRWRQEAAKYFYSPRYAPGGPRTPTPQAWRAAHSRLARETRAAGAPTSPYVSPWAAGMAAAGTAGTMAAPVALGDR